MARKRFSPYQNEADCVRIADLTIENRFDRVSIYGSLDIWKERGGLRAAQQLKAIVDGIVAELEKGGLPDRVELAAPETVSNPFE